MPDISGLIAQANTDGRFADISNNTFVQFGSDNRRYIGAELLPERNVTDYMFKDEAFKMMATVANDETRHSPPTLQKMARREGMQVILADSGIATQLNSPEYESLVDMLNRNASMDAMTQLLQFPAMMNRALVENNEIKRWQMIERMQVTRKGDNGYGETVQFDAPAGHRVNAGATYTGDATVRDPFTDILAGVDFLAGKGKTVRRIITSRPVASILTQNAKIMARTGITVVNSTGNISVSPARATADGLSSAFNREGLPTPETYDLMWTKGASSGYFLSRNVIVLIAGTENNATVERNGSVFNLEGTLGYTAIGRVAGFSNPGRQIRVNYIDELPPRVEGSAKQTSFPVLQDRDAVYVIGGIT